MLDYLTGQHVAIAFHVDQLLGEMIHLHVDIPLLLHIQRQEGTWYLAIAILDCIRD